MVDLLSANLNGVGGIRTVDSRRVISTWTKRGGESGFGLDGALAVAREVDAGSVLTEAWSKPELPSASTPNCTA